jgi:leucyl-tRNA synthetase
MFLGPWDQGGEWSDAGLNGMARWQNRLWEMAERDAAELDASARDDGAIGDLQRAVHKSIRRVTDDLERFKFNTSLAALMELSNTLTGAWEAKGVDSASWSDAIEKLLLLLAPMAPHITEELWERTGHAYSIHSQRLPSWDPALAADEVITLVVQVNGRLRDRIEAPASITEDAAKELALGSPRVQPYIEGKTIARAVYVPGKLVNIVVQ